MGKSFEQAKYYVTRNIFIFTCSAMFILALVNLITNGSNFATASVAVVFSGLVLVYLLKSKSYYVPAIIAIILAFGLNFSNLLRASNFENYIDLFWVINLSLFAYFTLGKIIGHFYLFINLSSVLVITIIAKMEIINLVPASNIYDLNAYIDLVFNVVICTLFFGYLVSQFLKQSSNAKKEIQKSNIELQKQYDEKSIMLKEIHHRVKNNLQVITSLLRLQLYKIGDIETAKPFNESIDRISSMALIHEKMYQGNRVSNINLKEYIEDLSTNLMSNYANEKKINLKIESSVNQIELNHIAPLSLIINKLISSSLRHIFKTKDEITITISDNKNSKMAFCYKDNGEWKVPKNSDSFGLELVETFTEQINGSYTFKSTNGTEYCFTFNDIILSA